MFKRKQPEASPAGESVVVTLPRSRRRSVTEGLAARRRNRQRQREEVVEVRPHGWARAEDPELEERRNGSFLDRRRATGTPLLLFTVLAVLTGVGLARVRSRIEVLQVANEITTLSEQQQQLLDRKRRLETERAYLRRPQRVAKQAGDRLGMEPAPPDRIQRIELEPAKPESESESEGAEP